MIKILGLFSLAIINSSVLYLIYWYIYIACSIKVDNILNIPYEPSGMQLFFYILSFPFVIFLGFLSLLHSYYFNLRKSLCSGLFIIWLSYFVLIQYVDLVLHFSIKGNNILYYGTLIISLIAIAYITYSSYHQFLQMSKLKYKN